MHCFCGEIQRTVANVRLWMKRVIATKVVERSLDGSFKSMKASLALEVVQTLQDKGCRIGTFTGNIDITMLSKLKKQIDPESQRHKSLL